MGIFDDQFLLASLKVIFSLLCRSFGLKYVILIAMLCVIHYNNPCTQFAFLYVIQHLEKDNGEIFSVRIKYRWYSRDTMR